MLSWNRKGGAFGADLVQRSHFDHRGASGTVGAQ